MDQNQHDDGQDQQHGRTDGPAVGVPDEALPDDLVPGEDNPLAEGLPDGETVPGLLSDDPDEEQEDGA